MKDLPLPWPLQNPQNSEILLQSQGSEAPAGEQEDGNGNLRHKLLWIAKVLGKTVSLWKDEINFYGKQLFPRFLKGILEYMQLLFTSLFSLFWSFSVVPSNSFQTDSFLPTVPAVCSNTYCIALLPFLQQHESLSAYGSVFALLLPQINRPQKPRNVPA